MTQMIASSRILLNANYILSSWVYLDDMDTSKNVLYVISFHYNDMICISMTSDRPAGAGSASVHVPGH